MAIERRNILSKSTSLFQRVGLLLSLFILSSFVISDWTVTHLTPPIWDFVSDVFSSSEHSEYSPLFFESEDQNISPGSYIVNMGVEPQTVGNALKPYGLVYTLVREFNVPVLWAINNGKSKDGIDFTYDGTDYKGGPFIIEAGYRNATVDSVITSWESQGVVGLTNATGFTAPIALEIDYFMNWTLDLLNGSIAEAYLLNAGIPSTGYNWVTPDNLNCCNDIFVMPHADPTWATHGNLYSWTDDFSNGGCRGALWMACHAVSVLENTFNPADSTQQMNFTMTDPIALGGEAAVSYLSHGDGTLPPPYIYSNHDHPVMQFLGAIDGATQNGSEQIYLPEIAWRPEMNISITDGDHNEVPSLSPGPAAAMAFGHTFGDTLRGRVMVEAGHDHQGSGTVAEQIAAQRAFLNFSFWAVEEKIGQHDIADFNVNIEGGDTIALSISSSGGVGPFTYEWSSECAGTFSKTDTSATSFFSSLVDSINNCPITVTITNGCDSIIGFESVLLKIIPPPTPPVAINDSFFVFSNQSDSINVLVNDSDLNEDPLTVQLLGNDTTANGFFTDLGNGQVKYTSTALYIGLDSIEYEVCDTTPVSRGGPLCDTAFIYVVVDTLDANGCSFGSEYISNGYGYGFDRSKTGTVAGDKNVIGIPNGTVATIDEGGGSLTVETSVTVKEGDTIFFAVSSQDVSLADFKVSESFDGASFGPEVTRKVSGTNLQLRFYIVQNPLGANYIKFEKNNTTNNKDVKVDFIRYGFKACIFTQCSYPEFYKQNYYTAQSHTTGGAANPNKSLGFPDDDGAEVDNGDVLTLDLGGIIPQGSIVLLYLARDQATSIEVSSSLTTDNFDNLQVWTPQFDHPNYQQFQFVVTQPNGIRYVKFENSSEIVYVDAVEVFVNTCEDNTPIANPDLTSTLEDFDVTYNVLKNDLDLQGDSLLMNVIGGPSNGSVVASDSAINYMPDPDFTGLDTIFYRICDTNALCDTTALFVVVYPDGCGVDEQAKQMGTGYGFKRTKTGTVANDRNAIGVPDGAVSTIDGGDDGALILELSQIVRGGDTIFFEVAGQDASASNFEISISLDGINFVDTVISRVVSASLVELFYVVRDIQGARFIKFEKNNNVNNDDLKIDGISHVLRQCDVTTCTLPLVPVSRNGFGSSIKEQMGVQNPNNAIGSPDQTTAEIDNGEFLVVELPELVPPGGHVYLYMAHDGNTSSIDVSSSKDHLSYGDLQTFTPDYSQNLQQFDYTVNLPGGIRYILFENTSDVILLDAVEYVVNYCEDGTPQALPDSVITLEDFTIAPNVMLNDFDLQGDSLTMQLVLLPSNGTAMANDSLIEYTPDPDFTGLDTVYYSVCDTTPLCDTSFLIIDVVPDGCAPGYQAKPIGTGYAFKRSKTGTVGSDRNAIGIPDGAVSIIDGGDDGALMLELSDTLRRGDTLFYRIAGQDATISDYEISSSLDGVTYGNLETKSVESATLIWDFYIVENPSGILYVKFEKNSNVNNDDLKIDAIQYVLRQCDVTECVLPLVGVQKEGYGDSVAGQSGVGNPNNALGAPDQLGAQVDLLDILTIDLGETIPPGGHVYLYMAHDGNASNILVTSSNDNIAYGDLQIYAPDYDLNFQQFDYLVTTGPGIRYIRFEGATERILVDALHFVVNYCEDGTPVAVPDSIITVEDSILMYDVTVNDYDLQNNPFTGMITDSAKHGFVSIDGSGIITYQPDTNYYGVDSFFYKICDDTEPTLCDTTMVYLTINPINDAPDAIDDYDTLSLNNTIIVDVQLNDLEVESHLMTTSIVMDGQNGMATVVNGDSIFYNPFPDFVGNDSVIYAVCDDQVPSLCDTAVLYLYIAPCNYPVPLPDDEAVCQTYSVAIDGNPTGGTGVYVSHFWQIIPGGTASGAYLINDTAQVVTFDADTATVGAVFVEYTVTDDKGCPGIDTIKVTINGELSISETHVDVSCNATNDGSIDLTIVECALPITIDWDYNGIGDTDDPEDPTGLSVGFYNVTVTDGVGGRDSLTVEIVEKDFALSETHGDVTCNGAGDGFIDLTPIDGSAPITYSWFKDGSPIGNTTEDLNSLDTGLYKVIATDNLGCVDSLEISISENMLQLQETHMNVTTFNGIDGSIDLTVNFGTPPFDYDWDYNGIGDTDDPEDPQSLIAGVYGVTVTDAFGCQDSLSVEITQPSPIDLSAQTTYVSCDPGNDGTIDLDARGTFNNVINAPRTATFPAGTWIIGMDNVTQPGLSFTGSVPGYPNGNAGNGTMPFNLRVYGLANLLLQNEIPLFWGIRSGKGKDGVDITVNAKRVFPTEATTPSSYDFISGPLLIHPKDTAAARPVIQSMLSDSIKIYETTEYKSVEYKHKLTFKPRLILLENGNNVPIHSAYLDIAGISNQYWIDTLASQIDLDSTSCFTFASEPHWKDMEVTDYGVAAETGRVRLFVESGGNFLAQCAGIEAYENYEFFHSDMGMLPTGDPYYSAAQKAENQVENHFSESYFQIHDTLEQNPTGTFVGVHYPTGSTLHNEVIVNVAKDSTQPDVTAYDPVMSGIKLTFDSLYGGHVYYMGGHNWAAKQGADKPYDIGFVNGVRMYLNAAILTPPGRPLCPDLNFETITGPYTYDWHHIPGTDDPEDLTGLAPGTYTVTVYDAVGHEATLDVEVSLSPSITLSADKTNVSCTGASDGAIDLNVSGGQGPFMYAWNTGQSSEDLSNINEGMYSVTVTDTKGCKDSLDLFIENTSVTTLYAADFENNTGANNWTVGGDAIRGGFVNAVPSPYTSGGLFMELAAIEGNQSLVSDPVSGSDIDSGATFASSPFFQLPTEFAILSLDLSYYFAHDDQSEAQDYLLIELRDSTDNTTLLTIASESGTNSYREAQWTSSSTDITVFSGKTVYVYIEAADIENESRVEAALDNVTISGIEASVSGTVFMDDNFDGIFDGPESGYQGVIVKVYDGTQLISTDTTDTNGEYLITDLVGNDDYRLEFTAIPSDYYVSYGPDSKSEVLFVTGGTCNINLGISQLTDYCDVDPNLIIPCYVDGEITGSLSGEPVMVTLPLSADGHDFTNANYDPDYKAQGILNHSDIGTVYGIAWQGKSRSFYTSAFYKRYSGFGPGGPDAIYQVNPEGEILGVIELDTLLGIANSAGADVHDWSVGPNSEVYDIGAGAVSFDAVGKRGFGDLELSGDQNTLYAVNLWDRKLYALDVQDGVADSVAVVNSWSTPDELGNGDHRPYGLAWHNDLLFVGSVDSDSLVAYVHSFDPATSMFSLELTIPLDYDRQSFYGNADNVTAMPAAWNHWQASPYDFTPHETFEEIGFPQPMLSDIEFAANGAMLLGFRDRFGDQSGAHKYFDTLETAYTSAIASGDLLKACDSLGTYILETGSTGYCSSTGGLANSGPGGVEFYHWDIYSINNLWDPNSNGGAFHWETTQGGLFQPKGAPYVVTTASDPFSDFSGGILKFDNSNGGRYGIGTGPASIDTMTGGYTVFDLIDFTIDLPTSSENLGKANGLGDLEAACEQPLSIGNFVWYDVNQNGLQDPGEPPLVNVSVELYQDSILIGRDTTDENGFYFFGGINHENVFDTAVIKPLTFTQIQIPIASAKTNNGTVMNIVLVTEADIQSDSMDHIDSDATMKDSIAPAIVTFYTGFAPDMVYTMDIGFMDCNSDMDTIMYVGCQGDGYSITIGSSTYDENMPMGYDTLTNVYGCDSIVYTNLQFLPTYQDTLTYSGCQGDGYETMVGDSTFNESNPTGSVTFQSKDGCDSTWVVILTFDTPVVVEAGMLASPACSNLPVTLSDLGASITGGITTGKWTTSGTGTFDNNGDFGGVMPATIYNLSAGDIDNGQVILTLTSDDPPGSCEPEADAVLILINDLRCSQFPFTGN